jgi:hypothetical protein
MARLLETVRRDVENFSDRRRKHLCGRAPGDGIEMVVPVDAVMSVMGMTCNDGIVGWTKTHAAPTELSPGPPMMAVLPSPDSATEVPWSAFPTAPVPTSLLPCWAQTPLLRV